jgi:hypothetical protein
MMQNLYSLVAKKDPDAFSLTESEAFSVTYHDIFDYPLSLADLVKWKSGKPFSGGKGVVSKKGYYFVEGRDGLIYKNLLRKRISEKKMEAAKKAARVISIVPTVKMIAVTGSLAMGNSEEEGDIDLMIVAK